MLSRLVSRVVVTTTLHTAYEGELAGAGLDLAEVMSLSDPEAALAASLVRVGRMSAVAAAGHVGTSEQEALDRNHFRALHHLGIIALQRGQPQAAVEVLGRALAVDSRVAECHYNLAFALHALGRSSEAVAHYREAAKLKPQGRVRLVGSVAHDHVVWFYAACDIFAYPYLLDRPWVAVLEAQACGRPVVTMQTDSANLITVEGRTSLLARDLEEFQVHLAALAKDRARCEEMGKAAQEYVAEFHSMETRVRQIENLLLGHYG